jgi:hypothetical protein
MTFQLHQLMPRHLYSVIRTDALGQSSICSTFYNPNVAEKEAERLQLEPAAVANGWVYTVQEHMMTN